MSRYVWSDTLEPVLNEGVEADEEIHRLGRKLSRLAEEGGAMPAVEMEERTGAGVVWKPWIVGFARAMRLRPGGWARIESSNELNVQESVLVSQKLYDAAKGKSELEPMGLDLLDDVAPVLIGGLVHDLNASGKSTGGNAAERRMLETMIETTGRAARKAPCSCGSGREYRRCCGAH